MIHSISKLIEGDSPISKAGAVMFWRWPLTGTLKSVRLIAQSGGFIGPWRFDVRNNGAYLFSADRMTITSADPDDEKTGLSIAVTKGQTATIELVLKGSGQISLPFTMICEVDDGGTSIEGPGSSTDNEIPSFDGTSGATLQGSGVTAEAGALVAASVEIDGEYTLPSADGTSGQVMTTDGSGVVTWETPSGGGGAPDWGDIGGTLSDQTDLQSALDGKIDVELDNKFEDIEGTDQVVILSASDDGDPKTIDASLVLNDQIDLGDHLTEIQSITATDDFIVYHKNSSIMKPLKFGDGAARTTLASTDYLTIKPEVPIHAASDKTTPVDADELGLVDSADSNALKKLTWANLKATIKSYYDSVSATLTNKRVTPRIGGTTSSSTPTPDADAEDEYHLTALATTATFGAPSGTPTNGQPLIIRIKDNGTARSLSFNSIYRAIGVTLPTTTVISKTMYLGMLYNSADTKWDVVAVNQEA